MEQTLTQRSLRTAPAPPGATQPAARGGAMHRPYGAGTRRAFLRGRGLCVSGRGGGIRCVGARPVLVLRDSPLVAAPCRGRREWKTVCPLTPGSSP
ncbi:hypothetical protein GDO81_018778 [Engystomops pustulosus]|uniref:Uncharacterized protein n=1 Tax=Engystomops pustulosus TaxID=76066 RepID=A0AAV6YBU6_ENGPU|nr:hypothetical protein GDO81_018778 [Engystomops pustulosus]